MAVSYVGASNLIATNGTAPGAITPNASTQVGDLMIFFHYSRATGGNETVTIPTGFTSIINQVVANRGLLAVGYRIRQSGDTTFTATITNHTSGTSGETVLEWIESYSGGDPTTPIKSGVQFSDWASALTLGISGTDPILAPTTATLEDGDMAVVFAGRFENITAQTTLTGDNLTWTQRTRNDSTLGLDAGAVTQNGLNSSNASQTITNKVITTTGTAQAGAGTIFIIQTRRFNESISESATATDTITSALVQSVTKFELWNATTDVYVRDLINNDTIIIGTDVGTLSAVAIRARTNPDEAVGSVRLVLTGASSQSRTENTPPYFLYGDNSGNPDPWLGNAGTHSLTATPWTGANQTGTAGTPLTIAFDILSSATISESTTATESQSESKTSDVSISESANGTDSISSTASLSSSISETATANDSESANLSSSVSISESTTAVESQSSNFVSSVSINESTSANDSTNGSRLISTSISESTSATDSTSANYSVSVSISESVTSTDSQSSNVSRSVSISESANALDSQDGLLVFSRSINESVTSTESQSANVTFSTSLSEIANAFDSVSSSLSISGTISESGNATETSSQTTTSGGVSISENASATDSIFSSVILSAQIAEIGTANDSTSSNLSRFVSISESVTSTDSTSSNLFRTSSINESTTATDLVFGAYVISKSISESASANDSSNGNVIIPEFPYLRNAKIDIAFESGFTLVQVKQGSIVERFVSGKIDSGIQKRKTRIQIKTGTTQTSTGI